MSEKYSITELGKKVLLGIDEYEPREYCKAVKCPIQEMLETHMDGLRIKTYINICENECKHTTHEFYQWLQDQGYVIIK